jgi:hypothetical protein
MILATLPARYVGTSVYTMTGCTSAQNSALLIPMDYLPRVVLGPSPEGPQRVPEVAVEVGQHERNAIVENELGHLARRLQPQEQIQHSDVDGGVGEPDDGELGEPLASLLEFGLGLAHAFPSAFL